MSGFYDPLVYDARSQGVPGDVEFFLGLAHEAHAAGHPVLELATGTGRVAIPIAQAGISIVGLDLHAEMLARAAEKSAGVETARWVKGDMHDFELPERFGLAFIAFRSFQHMLTVEDQLSCLRCVRSHLVLGGRLGPGGRLVIDIFNPDIVVMGQWLGAKRGGIEKRRDVYTDPRSGRTVKAWETRTYDTARQEVGVDFVDESVDEEGVVVSKVYRGLKLRYTFRYEMEHLLARTGFEVEALYGDCFGGEFEDSSPEMIWLARRAE